jgi:hypothetical protein
MFIVQATGLLRRKNGFYYNWVQDFEYRIEHWSESQKIADVIAKKGPFLKLYNNYIREFSSLSDHYEDCLNRLPKFKKLVSRSYKPF